jgi:GYD domain
MMGDPTANRSEAGKKMIEAAGGRMICFFSVPADGPGVLVIFDVPEPDAAAAISGIVVATSTLHNVQLKRLLTQEEVVRVRQKAGQLRSAYTSPGK